MQLVTINARTTGGGHMHINFGFVEVKAHEKHSEFLLRFSK
jgi:hypothetical protein